ncbi:MAG: hypothetical protein J7K62_04015, partial [Thermoplasmata archaeon]|nr:hypothetical protein [Thermoplasmata archaeon]
DPNINLLMQDNVCAYIMSLGPLFLMSMFPSLPGFLCTLEWVSKMYVEFLNVGVINLDFRRTSYFRSLGRRRVKALVSRLLGEPLRGVLLQFRTTNMNSSIEPLEVETDSNGYAVAVFDGMSLSPGDTTSIIVRGEIRGKERHTVGGLYVRDNSNIRIKDVLEGRAVYVYDEGVESKSEDTVKEWGNRKFDYVQELLNQVVSRKFFLYDKDGNSVDYEFLEEDGIYGFHTEGAIEVLRSSFEWIGWRWSDVIIKLREQYENNFSYKEWRDKVVDKGLLVGDKYIYHPRRVVLEDTTNIARDGLLELYQNYVEVFIDSMMKRGEDYLDTTHNVTWVGRRGYDGLFIRPYRKKGHIEINAGSLIVYTDTTVVTWDTLLVIDSIIVDSIGNVDTTYKDSVVPDSIIVKPERASYVNHIRNSGVQKVVAYSYGGCDTPERFRVKIRSHRNYNGIRDWLEYGYPNQVGEHSREYMIWNREYRPDRDTIEYKLLLKIKDPEDTTKRLYRESEFYPGDWAGVDCNGFVQEVLNYGYEKIVGLMGSGYNPYRFVWKLYNDDSLGNSVQGKQGIESIVRKGCRKLPYNKWSLISRGDIVARYSYDRHIGIVYIPNRKYPKSSLLIHADGVFSRGEVFTRKVTKDREIKEIFKSDYSIYRFCIWP